VGGSFIADADERRIVLASLDALPIFPLPSAVLIPGGHLPLHVFEPRFRAMIDDVLARDRVLGVALLEPGWEEDYQGRPPVAPVLGAGFVQADERLPDGRHNILVHGVVRVRVLAELPPTEPFRRIRAEPLADVSDPGDLRIDAAARTLRQLVLDLAAALPDGAALPLADACLRERDPGHLADLVGAAVLVDHRERQEFLEELDVVRRLDRVAEAVAQALLEFPGAGGGGGGFVM
jgi:Lon protease-like protein